MPFNEADIDSIIRRLFTETYALQNDGVEAQELVAETVLLETGLDSLGFAILVTRLEEELSFDPFSLATEAYYPVTYGDFLTFYMTHQPADL